MRAPDRLKVFRREPWIVLMPLALLQWCIVAVFAANVQRNGWLFYQGGDQTWFYTSGWVLAHGHIPESLVGYAWPFVLVPLTVVAGPNFVSGLPGIVALQYALLLPIALASVYALATRIGGRLLGYWTAALWIVTPFAAIPLFVDRYHERWIEQTLPQIFGLSGLGDFPSMVFLLVAAVFAFRALDAGARGDTIATGLVTGFAIGIKPANGLFVFAPLVALALARRWRRALEFGLALVPALVTLTLWKYRGTGISVLSLDPVHLALGEPPHPSELSTWERAKQYVPLDAHQLNQQFLGFREFFWSARLLEYLPVAGAIAVARRSVPKAAFLAVWLAAFFLIKGSSPAVNVESGSLWRLLMPAWPAYFLLAASLPLLVPMLGQRFAERFDGPVRRVRWPRAAVVAAGLAFAVPLVATAFLPPSRGDAAAKLPLNSLFVPIRADFRLAVTPAEGGLSLEWDAPKPWSARSFAIVYRAPLEYHLEPTDPRRIHEGILCEPTGHAPRCTIEMDEIARTRGNRFVDRPGPGEWTYRIGIAANWRDDESLGDTFLVSKPLNVSVR